MTYIKAMAEKVELSNEDVITASNGGNEGGTGSNTKVCIAPLPGIETCNGTVGQRTNCRYSWLQATGNSLSMHDAF